MPTNFATLDEALDSLRRPGDVEARLAALRAIVEHWHGPIRPEDGMSDDELAGFALPRPLAWWYRWAGRRTSIMSGQNFLFSPRDEAHPYWQLIFEDGFLRFHAENQGVYEWRTLPAGDDPPVFGRFPPETAWMQEKATLSEHLVLNCILEAVVCHAEHRAISMGVDETKFEAICERVPPLSIGAWRWCETHFHAGNDVFMTASPLRDEKGRGYFSVWLGAKQKGALDFIEPLLGDEWEEATF